MPRSAAALALFWLLSFYPSGASSGPPEEGGLEACDEEDLDALDFSLLQTALSLEGAGRAKALPERPAAGPPAAAPSPRRSSLVTLLQALQKRSVNIHLDAGAPVILLFMVGFLIAAVFVIQIVSLATEPREKEPPSLGPPLSLPLGRRERQPFLAAPGSHLLPPPGSDFGGPSARESFASPSPFSPVMPMHVPMASPMTHRGSEAGFARAELPHLPSYQPAVSGLDSPYSRVAGSVGARTDASLEPVGIPDAICPALILPDAEAQFCLTLESLRRLSSGRCAVQILGPSRKPLLHARLPTTPAGARREGASSGTCWLELSTTATTKYPHACVGPISLSPGAAPRQSLEIKGPRGDNYGSLEQFGGGWRAIHQGALALSVRIAPGGHGLSATAPNGAIVATAGLVPAVELGSSQTLPGSGALGREADGPALRLQVQPGVDALLYLLCMLAVVLVAPELAPMRTSEGGTGGAFSSMSSAANTGFQALFGQ